MTVDVCLVVGLRTIDLRRADMTERLKVRAIDTRGAPYGPQDRLDRY
jgi:hypothetical protein